MIAVIDYGMGNLCSVQNALEHLGIKSTITSDPQVLAACDRMILPGVGAFRDCMENLCRLHLDAAIRELAGEKKVPLLGICLGMQMLYEGSTENGDTDGLGFLKGRCIRMQGKIRIPEIGWNLLEEKRPSPVFSRLSSQPYFYYVHSYYAADTDPDEIYGTSQYGPVTVPGLVGKENVLGCQFHPEKSGADGLAVLKYFAEDFYGYSAGD